MEKFKIKVINKIKIVIAVCILLLLLLTILFANKSKLFKANTLASNEYNVTINETSIDITNVTTAEPNPPVLGAGMIPIKWNESLGEWTITNKDDSNWYDYSKGIPATIMLSNGYYKSELEQGITEDQLAKNSVGVGVPNDPQKLRLNIHMGTKDYV